MKNYIKLVLCAIALVAVGNLAVIRAMEKEEIVEKSELNKAFLEAVKNRNRQAVDKLLESKPDVNATDENGQTPLHLAVRNGSLAIVGRLLDKGANVNASDNNGDTPLHLAAHNDNLVIVGFLLSKGAKVRVKNKKGKSPISLVWFGPNANEITKLLKEAKEREPSPERKTFMDIIKDLVPTLYEAIVAVDPTGADHIIEDDRFGYTSVAGVRASNKDGLPEIHFGPEETAKIPLEYKRAIIAHELGHYVLGHHFKKPIKEEKELFLSKHKEIPAIEYLKVLEKAPLEKRVLKIGKKPIEVGGKLPLEKTFEHAFSRQQEFEADRFAVIEFGIPIDDLIAKLKEPLPIGTKEEETFKSTHPLLTARIKQLEDLRREVELHKAQKRQPMPIDWKALAAEYLKESQS